MNLKVRVNESPTPQINHIIGLGAIKYREDNLGIGGSYSLLGMRGEHMIYLSRKEEDEVFPTVFFCCKTELYFYIPTSVGMNTVCPHCDASIAHLTPMEV